MITIDQIRAGRAWLGMSQDDLAKAAGLSQTGIARIETGVNTPHSGTLEKIKAALEERGIEFISGGVRYSGEYCEHCGRGAKKDG